jgi:hypothetical protein
LSISCWAEPRFPSLRTLWSFLMVLKGAKPGGCKDQGCTCFKLDENASSSNSRHCQCLTWWNISQTDISFERLIQSPPPRIHTSVQNQHPCMGHPNTELVPPRSIYLHVAPSHIVCHSVSGRSTVQSLQPPETKDKREPNCNMGDVIPGSPYSGQYQGLSLRHGRQPQLHRHTA